MEIQTIYESELNPENFNNHNHDEYNPYLILPDTKQLIIDPEWIPALSRVSKSRLNKLAKKSGYELVRQSVARPHHNLEQLKTDADRLLALEIYRLYYFQFGFSRWYPMVKSIMPEIEIIELSETDRKELRNISMLREQGIAAKSFPLSRELKNQISDALSRWKKVFVKGDHTSGKNDLGGISPCQTLKEVLDRLTSCTAFRKEWCFRDVSAVAGKAHIILMPWNSELDRFREFRVIVQNQRVIGISQQQWFTSLKYLTHEVAAQFGRLITDYYRTALKPLIKYRDVVLDVWLDLEERVHLIECNPGGAYSTSGSALFNWLELPVEPEFRILVSDSETL